MSNRTPWPARIIRLRSRTWFIGALGVHPAVFLDRENADLLRFITERRFRTVLQMRDFVNVWDPDKRGNVANRLRCCACHHRMRSPRRCLTYPELLDMPLSAQSSPSYLPPPAAQDDRDLTEQLRAVYESQTQDRDQACQESYDVDP
jgi:hypothetical protein